MHASVINFVSRFLPKFRVEGRRILEVGSYNVNGSVRDILEPLGPSRYVGIDLEPQERYVDIVAEASGIIDTFGKEAFDVVVSTEMFEHCADWENAVDQMRDVLVPGGLMVITTRAVGFPLHCYPADHWRYTPEDFGIMFRDYRVIYLGDDHDLGSPGVMFVGVKQPEASCYPNPTPMEPPFHSEEAHDKRFWLRNVNQLPPSSFKAFYHVACMGSWRTVFQEQCQLFEDCGLKAEAHVLGSAEDFEFVSQKMTAFHSGTGFDHYETPTLQALYEWSRENPEGAALYLHTKGVSQPSSKGKQAWRMLMEENLVRPWKRNLQDLAVFDMVGVNWMNSPDYPHYCGNFWMARCDWINSLPAPQEHRDAGGPWICDNPWERMHAELWIGCRPWHRRKSLIGEDENLWEGQRVFELLSEFQAC